MSGRSSKTGRARYCPLCDSEMPSLQCPEHHVPTVDLNHKTMDPIDAGAIKGTLFADKYALQSVLGRGATGTVFVAHQLAMNRLVALKVLHPELMMKGGSLMRFYREARSASLLEHPNIVRVFDFGMDDHRHQPFIAMNLVSGRGLDQILSEGAIRQIRTASILAQVARALVTAHSNGMVHRDLKPENIIVQTLPEGVEHATVLDFGMARILESTEMRATEVGMVVGTPAYMAPEQVEGMEADARSDLYSLGCILDHCLTGQPTFDEANAVACMLAQVSKIPPPLPERLPSGEAPMSALAEIRKWLLEKRPERRPQTTKIVHDVLTAVSSGGNDAAMKLLMEAGREVGELIDTLRDGNRVDQLLFGSDRTGPSMQTFSSEPPGPAPTDESTEVTNGRTDPGAAPPSPSQPTMVLSELGAIVTLPQLLDERFGDSDLAPSLAKVSPIVFDFDRVQRITSFGVREWIRLLRTLAPRGYYCFIRCHPVSVAQFNVIEDFAGRGEMLSLYVPYECPQCHEKTELLVDVQREKSRLAALELPPLQCARCRVDAELDDFPELYFQYVAKRPRPAPPPAVLELISGGASKRPVDPSLVVRKEVGERLTIFKLKGIIDDRASFRRLADGVEGDAVIDLDHVMRVAGEGIERLAKFLVDLSCDVHLVNVDLEILRQISVLPAAGMVRFGVVETAARCERCGRTTRVRVAGHRDDETTRESMSSCCGRPFPGLPGIERRLGRRPNLRQNEEVERYLQAHRSPRS
jgi:serine/threonine protein kinase